MKNEKDSAITLENGVVFKKRKKVDRWLDRGSNGVWDGIDYIFCVGGVLRSKTVRMYTFSPYSIF